MLTLLPYNNLSTGILPKVINVLLEKRREVKKALQNLSQDNINFEEKKIRLDIQQKALKLVANSMYGCLGFGYSRFYCKSLASLITALGRENLINAKNITETVDNRLHVIYGDTDSLMVNTNTDDIMEARKLGNLIKKKINKTFKCMYLDLEYIFSKMLLLRKKKYASNKIIQSQFDNNINKWIFTTQREIKGLDLVRRDWSILSKDIGQYILDIILSSDKNVDDVVSSIHEYLYQVRKKFDQNQFQLEQYNITKKLTKQPSQYPDANKQPHVRVALQMQNMGIPVNVGDFIPYIICTKFRNGSIINDNNNNNNNIIINHHNLSLADRAYHLQEIINSSDTLQPDKLWYLENQILPPVSRYCDPIRGTDIGQLAHALGLDSSKFQHLSHISTNTGGMYADNNDQEEEDLRLQALTDVEERYKSCSPLIIQCPSCHSSYQFPGVFNIHNSAKCGLLCATDGCQGLIRIPDQDIAIIKNTVHLAIDQFISQYYDREWVCNDPTCLFKTRSLSLQGNFCPKIGCGSIMRESYSAEQLLNQIRYFKFLFDCDAAKDYIKRIRKSFVYLLFFKIF
ncbi:hypothetical protein RFI_28829 [Reticulomyxa filosa]|uniref:DNA-directed DNA polymerase n=1 Tax=Reticulomyxa filosa TaxID=46433 RepID=X6M4I3_RETFI|nr:hypothetical protein RFI_28829 [Reticulomyxa filosa]|eukprot:ETO08556.1 hypothetical protein RFI_28829 [Reticulomyxa filosa]